MTPELTVAAGLQRHQAGQFAEAEAIYRQVLAHNPNDSDALNLLGVLALQANRLDISLDLISRALAVDGSVANYHTNRAIVLERMGRGDEAMQSHLQALRLQPNSPEVHCNIGNLLHKQSRNDEAAAAFEMALRLRPDYAEVHYNLGNVRISQGRKKEAVAEYQAAVRIKPDCMEAYINLGNVLQELNRLDEAIATYQQALKIRPNWASAFNNLGNACRAAGRLREAIAYCQQAIALNENFPEAHYNLANSYRDGRQLDLAIASYSRAVELKPDYAKALVNWGVALREGHRFEEAIACYQRALALQSKSAEAHNNLGNILKENGQLNEAIDCFKKALELAPKNAQIHSNWIYLLYFHPDYDAAAIFREHQEWARRHAEPVGKLTLHHDASDRPQPDRKLRVGYLSPNFYSQAESFFVVPLLEAHDRTKFEIFAYSCGRRSDEITERTRRAVDHWRDVVRQDDERVAEQIRDDKIDVLVDLSMHMGQNQLLVLARKPAPIQVTWLAYPGTTGLPAVDYRFTDAWMDAPDAPTPHYSEESIWLPDVWCCYDPLIGTPPVNQLPALDAGVITFGSLNNFCKLNDGVLDLWSQALIAVGNSRLLLLAPRGQMRKNIVEKLASRGVAPDRVEFVDYAARPEYLKLYNRIDICLDPLPYNGITTTCDALWMGVPVVSLAGQRASGRAGASLLSGAGFPQWTTRQPADFVRVCAELASDVNQLAEIRASLRQKMKASILMDFPRFARGVEHAYRMMWQSYCGRRLT
jgi:protein O-GlcNAc transferase